ncbi:MAG: GntR family transcriptional regulator [Blastocatellia bacterium]
MDEVISLSDTTYARVREKLREDILAGVFEPGVRIKITDLSQRYGVSQMPIREALQQLQGEGLVTIAPNKGASVRSVDEKFISNIYDIRGALEAMLVQRAVAAITDAEVKKIEAIQTEYEAAQEKHDTKALLDCNQQFHHAINVLAQNPEALEMLNRSWGLIDFLRQKYKFGPNRLAAITSDHRNLLKALKRRDADAAERLAKKHCEMAKADLISQMRAGRLRK